MVMAASLRAGKPIAWSSLSLFGYELQINSGSYGLYLSPQHQRKHCIAEQSSFSWMILDQLQTYGSYQTVYLFSGCHVVFWHTDLHTCSQTCAMLLKKNLKFSSSSDWDAPAAGTLQVKYLSQGMAASSQGPSFELQYDLPPSLNNWRSVQVL